jgi:hypothetical protein
MREDVDLRIKGLFWIVTLVLLIGFVYLVNAVNFSNIVSTCDAEDNVASSGTFGDACDSTDGSNLNNNDGSVETHTYSKNKFGGVRIQSVNTSILDCGSIDEVYICHERWTEAGDTLQNCDVSVDADGGGSYTAINSTCPGTTANPGVTCQNVTASETWTCGSFFGSSGTRALAKSEISRSNPGGASTASWDVLFFNVTYSQETVAPVITLLSPSPNNGSYSNTSTPTINFSIVDTGSNIDTCILELDHSNNTMTKIGSGLSVSCNFTTSSLSEGGHNYTIFANDTLNNLGSNGTFFFTVDSTFPLISLGNGTENDQSNFSRSNVYVNVSVTETNEANITFKLHNSTGEVNTTVYSSATREINWTGLSDGVYTYNVTIVDLASNSNTTATRTIRLDNLPPNVSTPVIPISGNNYSGTFVFNVSINDVTLKVGSVIFNVTNSSGAQNATFTASNPSGNYWNASINTSDFPEGTYNISIIANDSVNNINNSELVHTLIFDNTAPGFVLNSPANDTISQDAHKLLNVSITDNLLTSTIRIYGGDETTFFDNSSLLYKKEGVVNNTEIIYNWTSPVLNVTADTVLLMHFDLEGADNETHVEDETGVNNGTKHFVGGPAWNQSGKFGYALGFDGSNDGVTISDSNSLDLMGNFSISLWVYMNNVTKNQTFLAKGSGTSVNYFLDFKTTNDNQVEFGFYNGAFRSLAVNASELDLYEWNLITATWNETSNISRVYLNGVDKGSLQLDYNITRNSNALTLGHFQGYTQNFSGLMDELAIFNKTLNSSEVTDMFKLKDSDWYWQVEINDTASNLNTSEIRFFSVGSIWSIAPTDLGSVGAALSSNVSIGNVTINVTHLSRNVTINITHDYSGVVTFNETLPYALNGSDMTNGTGSKLNNSNVIVQINVTSPATEGSTTIVFNVTGNDSDSYADSIPPSATFSVVMVATQSNPFLITKFEAYPTVVSQNNTGINLIASVTNRGQGDAQNTELQFQLPTGWSNASGNLNQSLGIIDVNKGKNASLMVDIASNATSGIVVLYANVSAQNASAANLNSTFINVGEVNVTVNAISSGAGPSTISVTPASSSGGSGGGGGGRSSSGGSIESVAFSEAIEVVRGAEGVSFDISISPKYINTSLENLIMTLKGYPEQYISVSPTLIDRIRYGETKNFTIKLNAPAYASYEEHDLTITINGDLVRGEGSISQYLDTRNVKLIIQEVDKKTSENVLDDARKAIESMKKEGFNVDRVERLLRDAENKLLERKNKEAIEIAESILEIKDKAFEVDILIRRVIEVLKNPRRIKLLVGDVTRDFESDYNYRGLKEMMNNNSQWIKNITLESGGKTSFITGKAVIDDNPINEMLSLALLAFDRGDYDLAEERAKQAQTLTLLNLKGNFGLFLYLYWYFILLGMTVLSVSGVLGYRRYQKSSISNRIEDINKEEDNIRNIMISNQRSYFLGKISSGDYNRFIENNNNKITKIRKERIVLRNKRVRILKARELMRDLDIEVMQIESEIKELQKRYYLDKKTSEKEYKNQFEMLQERLAEIETERTSLELMNKDKSEKKSGNRLVKEEGGFLLDRSKRLKKKIRKVKREGKIKKLKRKGEVGFFVKIKNFLERVVRKNKNKNAKKGVMMIDGKIIEELKNKTKDKDVKGKWIELIYKENENEG